MVLARCPAERFAKPCSLDNAIGGIFASDATNVPELGYKALGGFR